MTRNVSISNFAGPHIKHTKASTFFKKFPDILAGKDLKDAANTIIKARKNGKHVILGIGGHVIKVGLSPIITDLIERKIITGISMNGAAMIHDVEVALYGDTSENVDKGIENGTFGNDLRAVSVSREIINAISVGASLDKGVGEAVGNMLVLFDNSNVSILKTAYKKSIPAMVHIASGTDIIHMNLGFDPVATGKTTHTDFKFFCQLIREIEGGVYLNVGSAVILPEIFLKAVSLGRYRNYKVTNFTTIVMDFLKQYRPMKNVCERPTEKGIYLVGHHEIMFPLLAAMIIEGS
ncbi:MAG: deoxyhypusine synthase family protein [Candidatus Thorarchaeota archaeon]|jgi:hypothetical protein